MISKDEKYALREHMSMRAFTFMLDDVTKVEVLRTLREHGVETKKGSLSALIRVLLNYFVELPNDDPLTEQIIQAVEEEYLFTTKKNKRSTM